MTFRRLIYLHASMAALAAIALPVQAGSGDPVVIEQVNLGAALAVYDAGFDGDAASVSAGAASAGNLATGAAASGNVNASINQRSDGYSGSALRLRGGSVTGSVTTASTAYGNSAATATEAGNSSHYVHQKMTSGAGAWTDLQLTTVGRIETATTAAGNVSVSGSQFGDNRAFQSQDMTGSVVAQTNASLCCVTTSADIATTATGNAASSSGWTSTSYMGAVQTNGYGAPGTSVDARADIRAAEATDLTSTVTAAGNSAVLVNEWGYATLGRQGSELYQGNGARVVAVSEVELGTWNGNAASVAYGAGNTAEVTNTGSDTGLNAIQSNYGNVDAWAGLDGASLSGGAGSALATAIGNSASATLCNTCGEGVLQGNVSQYNAGGQSASVSLVASTSGAINGAATAVGNAATFVSKGN